VGVHGGGPAASETANMEADVYPGEAVWTKEAEAIVLLGRRCVNCSKCIFPPRDLCDKCGTETATDVIELSGVGSLYSFTEVHVAPRGFQVPYVIGYVDLPEGVRVLAQIESPLAELRVGDDVQAVLGVISVKEGGRPILSYKFRKRRHLGG
jgi:uncharacterized OB-fold protein